MKVQSSEIHPELESIAKKIPRISVNTKNLWLWRLFTNLRRVFKIPEDVRVQNISIPSKDKQAKIRLRLYQPKKTNFPVPALIWIHGGGYVMGKPEMDDRSCIQYVREVGIPVVSVDYRFAPEHPFPTPLEDCYSALLWVQTHGEQFGIDADRLAVGGESAGGGLAAALIQLAHDRNEINPVFQLLVCPMLDDRTSFRNDIDKTAPIWSQESNRFGWDSYLGKPGGTAEPAAYSVPSRRKDLTGLPPAWIGVGTLDLFRDEAETYAKKLRNFGVASELQIVPGAFHGFDNLAPKTNVARDFKKSQIDALKASLLLHS